MHNHILKNCRQNKRNKLKNTKKKTANWHMVPTESQQSSKRKQTTKWLQEKSLSFLQWSTLSWKKVKFKLKNNNLTDTFQKRKQWNHLKKNPSLFHVGDLWGVWELKVLSNQWEKREKARAGSNWERERERANKLVGLA